MLRSMDGPHEQGGKGKIDYQKIGERIRMIRIKCGMTQERLAEAADLSVPYISHVERGCKRASLETLVRVAGALDVTVDCLLSGIQPADRDAFLPDIRELLDDCSPRERRMLLVITSTVKRVLREAT